VVNILGLDESFEIIFKNLGKVVLKFRATKVFQDFCPIGRILESLKIRKGGIKKDRAKEKTHVISPKVGL
jgi:hypothetical protein